MSRDREPLDAPRVESLRDLVDHVGRFYVRNEKMEKAHTNLSLAIARGLVTARDRDTYLTTVQAYFAGFDRDARLHLVDVETRLRRASQVQFNLTAERDVATSRVEAVQGVLARLAGVASS